MFLTFRADALPGITKRAIALAALWADAHLVAVLFAEIMTASGTARGALRANGCAADIAFFEIAGADMALAACADGGMARTGHFAADLAFPHMVDAERLAAFRADKGAFFAYLPPAERAGFGVRAPDMLIAAWAGDEAIEADRVMTDVALDDMNVADKFAAFAARRRAIAAEMLATEAAAEQMRGAERLAAQMARFSAFTTNGLAAFRAFSYAAGPANPLAANVAGLKTRLADRMFAALAQSDNVHFGVAGRAFRIQHFARIQVVMRLNNGRERFLSGQREAIALKWADNRAKRDRLKHDLHLAFLQFVRRFALVFRLILLHLLFAIQRQIRDFFDELPVKTAQTQRVRMKLPGEFLLPAPCFVFCILLRVLQAAVVHGFCFRFCERKPA